MPKAIKGHASRKPPEPSANHSDIDDWLRRQMPHLQPIVQRLDEAIRATIPGLYYAVKLRSLRPFTLLPELGHSGRELPVTPMAELLGESRLGRLPTELGSSL